MGLLEILILVAIAVPGTVFLRRRAGNPGGAAAAVSRSFPYAPSGLRLGETGLLAAVALAVFFFTAANGSTNGLLFRLAAVSDSSRSYYLACTLACGAALIGSLAASLKAGFFRIGVALCAGTLTVYGMLLNGPGSPLSGQRRADSELGKTIPETTLTIKLGNRIEGADLWFNGTHLGKTPVVIDPREFDRLVPLWDTPPEDLDMPETQVRVPVYSLRRRSDETLKTWAEMTLPGMVSHYAGSRAVWEKREKPYYVRAEYRGHPVLFTGNRSGGGGGGMRRQRYTITLGARCPARDAAVRDVLNRIRRADYRVDDDTASALDDLGPAGVAEIREAAVREPEFYRVIDRLALRRWGIPASPSPAEARALLERIAEEADHTGRFDTESLSGRAAALLCPYLDGPSFCDEMAELVPSLQRLGHQVSWRSGSAPATAYVGLAVGDPLPRLSPVFSCDLADSEPGERQLPARVYVYAHAVRVLDAMADRAGGENPVEVRLVPVLLRYGYSSDFALRLATHLGGETVGIFLLRQPWRRDVRFGQSGWSKHTIWTEGEHRNRWAHMLVRLPGPEGEAFRRENADRAAEFARAVITGRGPAFITMDQSLAFLFDTMDAWEGSLAEKVWPEYMARCRDDADANYAGLDAMWKYLAAAGEHAPEVLFASTWRDAVGRYSAKTEHRLRLAYVEDQLAGLPPGTRVRVLQAIRAETVAMMAAAPERYADAGRQTDDETLRRIDDLLVELGFEPAMERFVAELSEPGNDPLRRAVAGRLAHEEPCHPLVSRLARAEDPGLRLLVVPALRGCPTPANRALLDHLREDPDAGVRAAVSAPDPS